MSRLWSFTFCNYTRQDLDKLSVPIEGVDFLVFGKEAGVQGPFLQGTIILKEVGDLPVLERIVSPSAKFAKVGRYLFSNIRYCKKDGDYIEWGTVLLE